MKYKIGRREFDITNNDKVHYNGACYQLMTQTYGCGWKKNYPVLSKSQSNKLIKSGALVLLSEKLDYVTQNGDEMWSRWYRFDISKLPE